MNLEEEIIKTLIKFCEYYKIDINSLENFEYGGANIVKKCCFNQKEIVIKFYRKNYYFDLINYTIKKLNNRVIKTIKMIDKFSINNFYVVVCNFEKGIHKQNISKKSIDKIIEVITILSSISTKSLDKDKYSIFNKYNTYKNYFLQNKCKKITNQVIETILKKDKINRFNKNNDNLVIVHGDLSPTNILWYKNTLTLIDFDECCLAPKEYELASFLIKYSFHNGIMNLNKAKTIIDEFKEQIIDFDIKKLKKWVDFYVIKVLLEKLYYYESIGVDIESDLHKKDYWCWWYSLLQNNEFSELFNENMVLNYNIIEQIKNNNNKIVYLAKKNSNKYIIKIQNGVLCDSDYREQKLLKLLSATINVPNIYKMINKNNKKYKIYTFIEGENKCENISITELKICINEVHKLSKKLESISSKICYPEGNIIEKLKTFYNSNNENFIKNKILYLLNNKMFLRNIAEDKKIIIHDDLHRENILFFNKKIGIIDFEGLKKYPKTMQLASFITMFSLAEYKQQDNAYIINQWNEKVNIKFLYQLILFRLIKGYTYFVTEEVDKRELWRKELLKKRIIEWSDKL